MQREELTKYKLPDSPGVYFFKKGRKILYIGKAASLRDRVRSYFSSDLQNGRGPAIVQMVADADTITWLKTDSVLEALLVEAAMIKRYQPPVNVEQKDNTSFNYLVITKEDFPRILVVRGRELFQNTGFCKSKFGFTKSKYIFGPFPEGQVLQDAIRVVRKIFPFRDSKCVPYREQMKEIISGFTKSRYRDLRNPDMHGATGIKYKPCFYRQIGLCPGVCTGEVTKEEYAHTIRNIRNLFSGNFHGLKRKLAKEMRAAAKAQEYEKAATLRRQIHALEHIRDVSLIKNESRVSAGGPSTLLRVNARIEAFDVAHTGGEETVGVMTVVHNGEMIKAAYRKFTIQTATNDDVAALVEILSRRLGHTEWPLPHVFVVDGGKNQVRAAERLLKKIALIIPVVGVVKDEHHRPKGLLGDTRSIAAHERDIVLANSEAHRFGITFHRARRHKRFRDYNKLNVR